MLILPTDSARAHKLLRQIIDQRTHVTFVVFGDGEAARAFASRADVRAENHPYRKVVWVPSPSVLAGIAPKLLDASERGVEAVVLDICFEPVRELRGPDAARFTSIERAFIDAGLGAA